MYTVLLQVNGESLLGKSFQEIKSVLDLLSDLEIRVHLIERDGDRLAYGNKTKKVTTIHVSRCICIPQCRNMKVVDVTITWLCVNFLNVLVLRPF